MGANGWNATSNVGSTGSAGSGPTVVGAGTERDVDPIARDHPGEHERDHRAGDDAGGRARAVIGRTGRPRADERRLPCRRHRARLQRHEPPRQHARHPQAQHRLGLARRQREAHRRDRRLAPVGAVDTHSPSAGTWGGGTRPPPSGCAAHHDPTSTPVTPAAGGPPPNTSTPAMSPQPTDRHRSRTRRFTAACPPFVPTGRSRPRSTRGTTRRRPGGARRRPVGPPRSPGPARARTSALPAQE